ncbi:MULTISPECIES: hypothetical protein [Aeromicrobium]|uniref:hypothetical protein n=1 Tax=Aeromicrobium TaxID=2040 RepID=UPI00257DBC04|nr:MULTISPECIES: hypothetical protein [Aeromicrobium]
MLDVLTTARAVALHGRSVVRQRIRSGAWQQPMRGVVVTHNGPLTSDQLERAWLAASPSRSALAGLTAARRWGLKGFDAERISIVLPEGGRRPHGDIELHWSTQLDGVDVPPNEPRRTTLERSIVDAASWAATPRRARALVIAAFQQRLTSVVRMRRVLERRGNCRHKSLIIQSVLDARGGIQSLPERDFDALRLAARLPRPTRQARAKGRDGRYYLDAWWERFNLAVEIHGIPHLAIDQWSDDLHRSNELVIDGRRVLAFSSFSIRHEPDRVIDQLLRATARPAA